MKGDILTGEAAVSLGTAALARLMPMYLHIDNKGTVLGVGPTLLRVFDHCGMTGNKFLDLFQVRRPTGISSLRRLSGLAGERVHLDLKSKGQDLSLRGLCVEVSGGKGYLLNLSFGIALVDAVRDLRLTETDFAPTDLAIEMLYLVEAKTAVMRELRDLNLRLQGAKQEAEQQALTDTLTGLRNRRALEAEMARLIKRGAQFSLMHLDLDYFKQVNDTLGHAAGDFVLRQVAQVLSDATRASDTIARVGGDEFVMIFQGLTDVPVLLAIAARTIDALSVPMEFEGQPCQISGSIGLTHSLCYRDPDIEQMHADADTALYESKRAGRGRATMFSPGAALVVPTD